MCAGLPPLSQPPPQAYPLQRQRRLRACAPRPTTSTDPSESRTPMFQAVTPLLEAGQGLGHLKGIEIAIATETAISTVTETGTATAAGTRDAMAARLTSVRPRRWPAGGASVTIPLHHTIARIIRRQQRTSRRSARRRPGDTASPGITAVHPTVTTMSGRLPDPRGDQVAVLTPHRRLPRLGGLPRRQ